MKPIIRRGFTRSTMACTLLGIRGAGWKVMTAWRQEIELLIEAEDLARLVLIARSRTEPASRVERAQILLAYREDLSFFAVGRALGVHHQTVQRCVEFALASGPMAALDDRRATEQGADDHR